MALIKLINFFKRKRMKIAHCHRHIAKSEYQPCIAVQTHDTSLFPPKDTTGNTDSLLFLKIVLQRPVHQLDIVRHGFIQIDKFLHLTLRNYRRTVCVIVRHQILAGKHGRQNTFQLPQGSTYKQPTVAFNPFLVRQRIQFLSGAGSKSLFHHPGRVTASGIFLFGISTLLETFPMIGGSVRKHLEAKKSLFYGT